MTTSSRTRLFALLTLLLAALALAACDDDGGGNGDPDTSTTDGGDDGGGDVVDDTADTVEPPVCSAETAVCDPACSAEETCVFDAGSGTCGCTTICDSAAPVCPGGGPNSGCADGFFCDVSCTCVEAGCNDEQPECSPACGAGQICVAGCVCEDEPPPPPTEVLARPSRSTAVDISRDDSRVAMVNTDDGSLSLFDAGGETLLGRAQTSSQPGSEPGAVVFHPDGDRVFVANRAAGTVSMMLVSGGMPLLELEADVGGEPMGLALTPTGAQLFVTDWVGGRVVVLDTSDLSEVEVIDVGGNPFAIAITNDLDLDDADEKALVTQFFGRSTGAEASDTGREGVVDVISVETRAVTGEITLGALPSCFSAPVGGNDVTSGCFPNQLYGITIHTALGKTRAYVVSVAAGPQGPVNFNHNMQALLSVIDVDAEVEETALTRNLNALVKDQVDTDGDESRGRRFLNIPNGIAFVPREDILVGYVTAGASDIVLRVEITGAGEVAVGSPLAFNIPVGFFPQGIVTSHATSGTRAFVANLVSRDLSVLSLRDQEETARLVSTAQPTAGSADFDTWRGKRFFFTSTGIWSKEGWGSCGGCHPMGLTDNVTWQFAAGPRQTVSMDGQYASDDPTDMRALNWTAIFDETHDFELNTRGVSGGLGAIQNDAGRIQSAMGVPFGAIAVEDGTTLENHQALNGSLKFITRNDAICTNDATCPDWDQVDAWVQTIRSPRGAPADSALVAQGRQLFDDGGCAKCHGGAKWTVSRTFYDPTLFAGALPTRTFATNAAASAAMDPSTLSGLPADVNVDSTLIAGDDSDGGAPALKRQACNIRNVGTFAADGGADEVRDNGTPAQGRNGYNVPSLLGLSVGAPYFHNGAAKTLDEVFDARFETHMKAGNPNFVLSSTERAAMLAFLRSIDESTAPFAIDPDTVLCPDTFAP